MSEFSAASAEELKGVEGGLVPKDPSESLASRITQEVKDLTRPGSLKSVTTCW
jgi:hypothetical protein